MCFVSTWLTWQRFRSLDSRPDQATIALCAKDLTNANHIFPSRHAGQSFAAAVEADQTSMLNPVGRLWILTPLLAFDSTSILANWIAMKVLGPTYSTSLLVSILASSLTSLVLAWWLLNAFDRDGRQAMPGRRAAVALVGALLSLICAYRFYFSPWGTHNVSVFTLTLAASGAAWFLKRWKRNEHVSRWAVMLIVVCQIAALYSYSINMLLLVPAVCISILAGGPFDLRKRMKLAAVYAFFALLITAPVLLRIYSTPVAPVPDAHPFTSVFLRSVSWFVVVSRHFSMPGLVVGIIGVILVAWRQRIFLPAALLCTHFALWTLMPSFTNNANPTYIRTFNYALPWLAFGVAGAVWNGMLLPFKWRVVALGTLAVAVAFHLQLQIRLMADPSLFQKRVPVFTALYWADAGSVQAWVSYVDSHLPPNATFLPQDPEVATAFYLFTNRADLNINRFPTLDTVKRRVADGSLQAYLKLRRRVDVRCDAEYVLSAESDLADFASVNGVAGLGCPGTKLEKMGDFGFPKDDGTLRPLSLYRIDPPLAAPAPIR